MKRKLRRREPGHVDHFFLSRPILRSLLFRRTIVFFFCFACHLLLLSHLLLPRALRTGVASSARRMERTGICFSRCIYSLRAPWAWLPRRAGWSFSTCQCNHYFYLLYSHIQPTAFSLYTQVISSNIHAHRLTVGSTVHVLRCREWLNHWQRYYSCSSQKKSIYCKWLQLLNHAFNTYNISE